LTLKTLVGSAVLAGCAVWAADISPLDVKLGQWETTLTTKTTGLPPIPQDVLEKMPPEARARMEERMKGTSNGAPHTTVSKSCLKKEDLTRAMTFGADDKACTRTVLSSSGSRQEIRVECNRNGVKQTGTIRIEAANSESVRGSMEMALGAMNINSTFSSKWLSSTCTEKAGN
jgi:hypothetical protein